MAHGSIPHPSAQSRTPVPGPDRAPARQPWAVLVLLCVAEFMVILDITVVNVALPSIGRALGLGAAGLPWVITAYVLMTGGLTLLGGRAADLLGRRRVFLAGLALFTAASLASGLAPAAGLLIGARAAQGVGAALLTPAALSVITATYAGAQRVTALSVWGALGAAGAAAGVLLGGVLTTWLGWRSVFLINVPVGAAAWILARRLIPRPTAAAHGLARLDLPGAVLGVTGLGTAIYAITGAPGHGWASAWTIGLLLVAALLLAAFALAERAGRDPLFPPRAWRNRRLASGALVMLGATGVLVAAFFLGSLYLQDVLGYSPIRAGLAFLPLVLVIGAGGHLASRLLGRAGSRVLTAAGLVLMAGGALLLAQASAAAGYPGLLPGFLVLGFGTGLVFPAASVTALADAGPRNAGFASGFLATAHELGAALGVAVFTAIAEAAISTGPTGTGGTGGAGALMTGARFAAGYHRAFTVAAGVAAALAVLTLVAGPVVRPAPGARAHGPH
jgi:EmrB/QacA subfamily drug resistance transporter